MDLNPVGQPHCSVVQPMAEGGARRGWDQLDLLNFLSQTSNILKISKVTPKHTDQSKATRNLDLTLQSHLRHTRLHTRTKTIPHVFVCVSLTEPLNAVDPELS